MEIDPSLIELQERYKLLIGAIVPRPIALVSTVSPDGRYNLAPFSFYNGIGSDPMSLLFCPSNSPSGTEKDTLRNAKPASEGGVGQFVVNVTTEAYERQMAAAAEDLPYGESEFEMTGLERAPSARVRPDRVALAPVCFECETTHVVRLNPGVPGGGNVVIGRVVHVFVRDGVVDERYRIDPERLRAVGRMAGLTYVRTRERFDIPWGREALGD